MKRAPYRRPYRKPQGFTPERHNHVGDMIFDSDFCCCRSCEQAWKLTERGWKPIPPSPRDPDGYDFYQGDHTEG